MTSLSLGFFSASSSSRATTGTLLGMSSRAILVRSSSVFAWRILSKASSCAFLEVGNELLHFLAGRQPLGVRLVVRGRHGRSGGQQQGEPQHRGSHGNFLGGVDGGRRPSRSRGRWVKALPSFHTVQSIFPRWACSGVSVSTPPAESTGAKERLQRFSRHKRPPGLHPAFGWFLKSPFPAFSSTTLGFPRKRRKRHPETTQPSAKSGFVVHHSSLRKSHRQPHHAHSPRRQNVSHGSECILGCPLFVM